jgi:hypothetical protein
MNRIYLPLLPLPVLAIAVAVSSACSKTRTEETTHVIPPAARLVVPVAEAKPPLPPVPPAPSASTPDDEKPTPEEVKAFERPVRK